MRAKIVAAIICPPVVAGTLLGVLISGRIVAAGSVSFIYIFVALLGALVFAGVILSDTHGLRLAAPRNAPPFQTTRTLSFGAGIIFFLSNLVAPASGMNTHLYSLFEIAGVIAIALIIYNWADAIDTGDSSHLNELERYLVFAGKLSGAPMGLLCFVCAALWGVGQLPADDRVYQLSAFISYFAALYLAGRSMIKESQKPDASAALSPRDIEHVAAHEAGHALTFAATGEISSPFSASVYTHVTKSALGFVAGMQPRHLTQDRSTLEWLMLSALAGREAELFLAGIETDGAFDDLGRWLDVARHYFDAGFGGFYYATPSSRLEQQSNDEKLSALQERQRAQLQEFFQLNSGTLADLAEELATHKTLRRSELVPYLERVVIPFDFPRVNIHAEGDS